MRRLLACLALLGLLFVGHPPARAAGGDASGTDRMVKLDPISLPTIRKGRPDRQITLVIVLELGEGRSRSTVVDVMPKLRDAYITELLALLDFDWPNGAVLDLEFARKRLILRSSQVLGEGMVAHLLFETVRERHLF